MSVSNFVQCGLVTPIATSTTELVLNAPVAPYQYPPLDGGTLVIADSVARPTFYEIISYTHRIDNVLYGVVRAKEGSTARAWSGATWIYQALTAADYIAALVLKADLNSPTFTGDPKAPTPAFGDNDTSIATTAFVQAAIAALVNASPAALDTLKELATSLGNDPNFATTMTNALAGKEPTIAAGTTAQYWKGNKTWADLFTDVRAATLTGLGAGTNATIVSTDTLLAALAKIQNQLNNKAASDDARLSDAREWTATQVSQAEAEAGTATTNRKWTAQRVAQAVRGCLLTGLNLTVDTTVAAADTVLVAIGKLQKQITDMGTNLAGNVRATVLAGYVTGANAVLKATDTVEAAFGKVQGQLNAKANLASPALTGTPTAPTQAAAGNSSTQIATTAFVQSVVNGYLNKTGLTGGTVTLTADEAANAVIGLSGTLTSNLIVEIPAAANRIYSISNGTTGAFTVSIKVVGLAPTVLVAQGKRNLIYTNTVGAYDAINDFDAIALTGVSTAATAAVGTNTTQIATTAFVNAEIANDAPTKTGGGASGSWGISVTGSSASCTGNAASATTLVGMTTTIAELNYVNGVTSNIQAQLNAKSDSGHTHSYLPLAGGSLTGLLTGRTSGLAMSQDSGAAQGSFTARATGTGDSNLAGMTFFNNAYAIKLGVRSDGYFGLGGWSRAAWSWYSDPSGNMVAAGNVTAYSDPRLKENFQRVVDPFGILNALDGGTFDWKHGIAHTAVKAGKRDYGVLADQVEAVMPEIVTQSIELDGETYRTVDYSKIVPVLIEGLKLLKQQVDVQARELAELRAL